MYRLLVFFLVLIACRQSDVKNHVGLTYFNPDNPLIKYTGRVDLSNSKQPVLIGSASFVEMKFTGNSCKVFLKKLNSPGEDNYISLEIDGNYKGQ